MARFSRWLKLYYDGVATLAVVGVTIALELLNVLGNAPAVDQAILVVLALLAFSILRDRHRTGQNDDESQGVSLLNAGQLKHELEEARRRTDRWWFKGGTGTYLRAMTLPECVRNAHREQHDRSIQVEIIDPTNEALCEYYARFRHSRPDLSGEPWTRQRARNEAYATILAACWYLERYTILRLELGLSATVPTFRWDLSSRGVFMTQEHSGPHVMFTAPSPHYDLYTRELRFSFRQAREVPLERASGAHLSEEPDAMEVRCVFKALDLDLPASVTDEDVADIVQRARHPRNPYP